jgi:hypothetical protein
MGPSGHQLGGDEARQSGGVDANRLRITMAMLKGMHVLGRSQPANGCGAVAMHGGGFGSHKGGLRVQDSFEELGCVVHVDVAIGVAV